MIQSHPLNVLQFCPRCGSAKFNKSCERSLKCADCKFHYYINSAAAVAALICNNEGKIMLVTRGVEPHYGKLDLPGGFIDPLETAENAVCRELNEELGLKVEALQYFCSAPNTYEFSEFTVFTLDMAFKVTADLSDKLTPMDDILAYKFYAENEINYDDIPAPSIKRFVKKFFNEKRNK